MLCARLRLEHGRYYYGVAYALQPRGHRDALSPGRLLAPGLSQAEEGRQESCVQEGDDARDSRQIGGMVTDHFLIWAKYIKNQLKNE